MGGNNIVNKISFIRIVLSVSVFGVLNLQLPVHGNSCKEGSGTKKHTGGSSPHHHEGSGHKKHMEGSGSHNHEGSSHKKHTEGSGSHQDHEAMMAKWKEFATPNENHKALDVLVGDWNHMVKWWMSANAEPEESTGRSEIKWILGDRFLQHKVNGVSMGQPFEGIGIIGYDNGKKEYNSIWIDSMGTGFMKGAGQYDANLRKITEEGHFTCPFRGQISFRGVTTIKDNDNYTYEMFSPGFDNKEYRAMEITYTRKE